MTFQAGHTPATKGRITTTHAIKDIEDVAAIKELLKDRPRDYALFVFALNSGFRASDTLSIRREDIEREADGRLVIVKRERKTGKLRRVVLNAPTSAAVQHHLNTSDGEYLFEGQRGPMTTAYFGRLVRSWCEAVGMTGNLATHSLRKGFVRLQLEHHKVPITTLQWMLNHQSPAQTLTYVGLLPEDAQRAYDNVL